jgi:hypothetical protein
VQVREPIDVLEQYDEDAEIRVAFQPSWPLRGKVANVVSSDEIRDDDNDPEYADPDAERDPADPVREDFVWIAVDQVSSSSENPYAPKEVW